MAAHLSTSGAGNAQKPLSAPPSCCYISPMLTRVCFLFLLPLAALAPAALAGDGGQAMATVVDLPAAARAAATRAQRPTRGMTKTRVANLYGPPQQRHPPIGEPPITRWDYPGYSVFFEYDLVLHAVVPGHLPRLYHRGELR